MQRRQINQLPIEDLVALREAVDKRLMAERERLRHQLTVIDGGNGAAKTDGRSKLKGLKLPAKYRSKKDRTVTWTGRGQTPRWLAAEMKAGKLKKDAFLIK